MRDAIDTAERLDDAAAHREECRHVAEHNADSDRDDATERISLYTQMMIDAVTGPMLRAALGVRK